HRHGVDGRRSLERIVLAVVLGGEFAHRHLAVGGRPLDLPLHALAVGLELRRDGLRRRPWAELRFLHVELPRAYSHRFARLGPNECRSREGRNRKERMAQNRFHGVSLPGSAPLLYSHLAATFLSALNDVS